MAYSGFTNRDLKKRFGVEQAFRRNLFAAAAPRAVSENLKQTLSNAVSFALLQDTGKARSEFIVAPIFFELKQQAAEKISVFSGVEFNVDFERGLIGRCDFLVSRSPYQAVLEAPIVVAVEAKRQDFESGLTQCIAEMIAARIFNEREENSVGEIYGCVTTGDVWRFLVLRGQTAEIEENIFDVSDELEQIFGVLWAMTFGEVSPN